MDGTAEASAGASAARAVPQFASGRHRSASAAARPGTDGVAAEILFPNYGMALFGIDDIETQQEAFKLYNDGCTASARPIPASFYASPLVSVYDIDAGIKEMQRGQLMGLKGAMVWQVPDPRLPFTYEHYEPLWAACAEAKHAVICHILTGHSTSRRARRAA